MEQDILQKIKNLKQKYEKEGFIIIGVFGSYARGEFGKDSDIDILYELKDEFYKRYPGFKIYPVLDYIEEEMQKELQHRVDLANMNALKEIGNKYILPEVVYV